MYDGLVYLIRGGPSLPIQILVPETEPVAGPDGILRIMGAAAYRYTDMVNRIGDFNADGYGDFLIGESRSRIWQGRPGTCTW